MLEFVITHFPFHHCKKFFIKEFLYLRIWPNQLDYIRQPRHIYQHIERELKPNSDGPKQIVSEI